MKLLLAWFADPPDPPYWEWIPNLDGLLISLSSLKVRTIERLSLRGIKNHLGMHSQLLIDSLTNMLWRKGGIDELRTQAWILHTQKLLGADMLIHKDYPFIVKGLSKELKEKLLRRTIINAELALRIAENLGMEIILVIQGWDKDSYVRCAKAFKDLGVKYVGIGSLAPKTRREKPLIVDIVRTIRDILGRNVKIHVFGVSTPSLIKELIGLVDSIDTSAPLRAAVVREVMMIVNGEPRRHKLWEVGREGLINSVSDSTEEVLVEKILKAKKLRDAIRYLAILNAYRLIKWVRKLK